MLKCEQLEHEGEREEEDRARDEAIAVEEAVEFQMEQMSLVRSALTWKTWKITCQGKP